MDNQPLYHLCICHDDLRAWFLLRSDYSLPTTKELPPFISFDKNSDSFVVDPRLESTKTFMKNLSTIFYDITIPIKYEDYQALLIYSNLQWVQLTPKNPVLLRIPVQQRKILCTMLMSVTSKSLALCAILSIFFEKLLF